MDSLSWTRTSCQSSTIRAEPTTPGLPATTALDSVRFVLPPFYYLHWGKGAYDTTWHNWTGLGPQQ